MPFVMAAFIAYVFEPPVSFLQSRGLSRSLSILAIYAAIGLAALTVGYFFIPRFLQDLRAIGQEIANLISLIQWYQQGARDSLSRYGLPAQADRWLLDALGRLEAAAGQIGDNMAASLVSSAEIVSYSVIAPVIAYYMLRDLNRWRERALVTMAKYPLPFLDLIRDIDSVLGGFVRGQAIVAGSVTLMVWIAASILGLKYAAVLGLISGLGEFVPFFGPLVAAVPTILAGFTKSTATGIWTIVITGAIQWFDSNIIVPRVTGPRVGLHPLWVIFALLAGGKVLGVFGVLFAVPLAGLGGALFRFARALLWEEHSV